jgi:hypothetical protein
MIRTKIVTVEGITKRRRRVNNDELGEDGGPQEEAVKRRG